MPRWSGPILLFLVAGCAAGPKPSAAAVHVLAKPSSGFVPVEGGRVWYQVVGHGTGVPLLVLHGGPGVPHDYLDNLGELGDGRPVVFYDQLGCGRSDRPTDVELWTVDRFVRELGQVRAALGLDEVVLYGHSWGAMLATEYLLTQPKGVKGLILAGPALDMAQWAADANALVATLDPATQATIRDAEASGTTGSDAYQAAVGQFYQRYLCRRDPWPQAVQDALTGMNESIYRRMCGPSEFTLTGTLKDVDLTPRLHEIDVPTLVICGEFDEARPPTCRAYAAKIPGADFVEIEGAAHLANDDRPEAYLAALRDWLHRRVGGR